MKNNKFLLAFSVAIALAATIVVSCNKKFDEPPFSNVDPNIVANTTIKALKAMHTVSGAYDDITTDLIISGVVIADDKSGNLYQNIYIQDSTGALNILLDASSIYGTYPVGRRVFIYCKGLTLTDYYGMIQLGSKATISGTPSVEGIPSSLISKYVVGGSYNNAVVAKSVTLAQLGTLGTGMQNPYLGSLIQIDNCEFIKGDTSKTFSDTTQYKKSVNLSVKQCGFDTAIIVRTSAYANFAAVKPPKANGTFSAIYTVYSTTKQLVLRDTSDIKFTGTRCNLFEEDFGSITNNVTISLSGWKNIGEVGGVLYTGKSFGSGPTLCGYISAYGTGQASVTSWLISPAITLPTSSNAAQISFTSSYQYANGAQLILCASTDYAGSSTPSTATWTPLVTLAPTTYSGTYTAFATNTADISAYKGKTVYFAWKYVGGVSTKTTNFEIDDIKIPRY